MKSTNEPSKSVWKKPWHGLRGLLLWLAMLILGSGLVVYVILLACGGKGADAVAGALVIGIIFSIAALAVFLSIRWLCCGRHFRWFLFGLACFATLIALFYAEENWRGKHAWEKFKREQEAKGEHFKLASLAPPPVPDDQNFAMAPIVVTSYRRILDGAGHAVQPPRTDIVNRLTMPIDIDLHELKSPAIESWQTGVRTDLEAWQSYYRKLAAYTNLFPVPREPQTPAAEVLLALSKYEPAVEELRQAVRRPYSRFPLQYGLDNPSAILLPHLASLRSCSRMLQLRAVAELSAGRPEDALADACLMLRLSDSVRAEPILISQLVRIAMANVALRPVWEGLAEHQWSDQGLVALDQELKRLDFLADYRAGMRGEVVCAAGVCDYVRRTRSFNWAEDGGKRDSGPGILGHLIPSGWFYQNELRCARFQVEEYVPLADLEHRTVSPASVRRVEEALAADVRRPGPYNLLEKLMLPALGKAVTKFAAAQASVDLARIACALERYRLAESRYPDTLDALVPRFLGAIPNDVIDGRPLHYRRTPDGGGVIYSVGWNETDDGGEPGWRDGDKSKGVDILKGDWVWTMTK